MALFSVIFMGAKNFKYLSSTEHLYLKRAVGFANFTKPQLPISLANSCRFSFNFPYHCIIVTMLGHRLRASPVCHGDQFFTEN